MDRCRGEAPHDRCRPRTSENHAAEFEGKLRAGKKWNLQSGKFISHVMSDVAVLHATYSQYGEFKLVPQPSHQRNRHGFRSAKPEARNALQHARPRGWIAFPDVAHS
jgi:hypothetical protein